jgi:UDP-N-acetylmuramate: L-alanyl-gamma-D-glutamyl-meso-diaminopimelate ligase
VKIHILGICGTFMAGIASLAKALGHEVTGSDSHVYPPMSLQLGAQGMTLLSGYAPENLSSKPDLVIIGNAITRGNAELEAVLNLGLPYTSGAQWLADNVLQGRHVLAVAGTHGKTTTASMLAWILQEAGQAPGFLIGGVPENFSVSASLGDSRYFVIEADEYDTAFFDKRSKFVHYRPNTLVLNNLEFDHADIFANLDEIKKQFHHLVRTIPSQGSIVSNAEEQHLKSVLAAGVWTPVDYFNDQQGWHARLLASDGSAFEVYQGKQCCGQLDWPLIGKHNVSNALAAIAAAHHIGITPEQSIQALHEFKSIKRRMELKLTVNDIQVYDDFAHHPTAIKTTVTSLKQHVGKARVLAVVELGSYTMRSGYHSQKTLLDALQDADDIFLKQAGEQNTEQCHDKHYYKDTTTLVAALATKAKPGDHVLVMSNTGFDAIFTQLEHAMEKDNG